MGVGEADEAEDAAAFGGGGGNMGSVDCGSKDDCGAAEVEDVGTAAVSMTDIEAEGPVAVAGREAVLLGEGVEHANKRPQRSRRTTNTAPPSKLAAMLTGVLPS